MWIIFTLRRSGKINLSGPPFYLFKISNSTAPYVELIKTCNPRWRTCWTPMMGCPLCTPTSICSPPTSTRSRASMRSSTERRSGANLSILQLPTQVHSKHLYQVPWLHGGWEPCQGGAGRPCLPPGSRRPAWRSHLQLWSVQEKVIGWQQTIPNFVTKLFKLMECYVDWL